MTIRTIGVLGCGLMGAGIARVCAAAGYQTRVRDVDNAFLQKGLGRIRQFVDDGVAKGKVTSDARDRTLSNLMGTTAVADLADCDVVIEAIVESLDEKRVLSYGLPLEHLVTVHHRAGRRHVPAGPLLRAAFLQPRCH
jgi:3-hydroxybutyryl-CoA dehydrogenase